MSLSTIDYLSLSAVAYGNFSSEANGVSLGGIIDNKLYTNNLKTDSPELSSLKDPSNPLRSYILLNAQSFSSGMSAIALQNPDTKEIVFAFRGSELGPSDLLDGDAIKDIANADEQIFAGYAKTLPAQFTDAETFVNSVLSKHQDSSNYTFTGHSLGGALAQYMTYKTNRNSVTFNAPGVGSVIASALGTDINYQAYKDKAINYANESDLVGNYRNETRIGANVIIQSNMNSKILLDVLSVMKMNVASALPVNGLEVANIIQDGMAASDRLAKNQLDPIGGNHAMSDLLDDTGDLMPSKNQRPATDEFVGHLVKGSAIAYNGGKFAIVTAGSTLAGLIWYGAEGAVKFINTSEYVITKIAYYGADGVEKFINTSEFILSGISKEAVRGVEEFFGAAGSIVDNAASISQDVAKLFYDISLAMAAVPDMAMNYLQFLATREVYIEGTAGGDEINAYRVLKERYPLLKFEQIYLKSTRINGGLGDDNIHGTGRDDFIIGGDGNDNIYGEDGRDVIIGGAGDDVISGGIGDDKLYGGHGGDTIYGYSKYSNYDDSTTDVIDGGAGNDRLIGGTGDDVYRFGIGYGQDTIEDRYKLDTFSPSYKYTSGGSADKIVFLSGILPDDIEIHRVDRCNLEVRVKTTGDKISIIDYFDQYSKIGVGAIELMEFSDGTIWTLQDIVQRSSVVTRPIYKSDPANTLRGFYGQNNTIYGSDSADKIVANLGDDVIYGYGDDDIIIGDSGSDILYGGDGDDKLYGDTENMQYDFISNVTRKDILDGGAGDDLLAGALDSDVYIFGRGYGHDTIVDRFKTHSYDNFQNSANDELRFKDDISPTDIKVHRIDDEIKFTIKDTGESITVHYFYGKNSEGAGAIEKVTFADGTQWDLATIKDKARYIDEPMTDYSGNNILNGYNFQDNIITDSSVNCDIYGRSNNDTFLFSKNSGYDVIYESGGKDKVIMDRDYRDIVFSHKNGHMDIIFYNSSDKLRIDNGFCGQDRRVEEYCTTEGYSISYSNVSRLVQAMASFGRDTGTTWQQALSDRPDEAQAILSKYWAAPTS